MGNTGQLTRYRLSRIQIFKILQFFGMACVLQLKRMIGTAPQTLQDLKGVYLIQQLDKFIFLVRISRKILRFLRAPPLFQRMRRSKFLELPNQKALSIVVLEKNFKAIADIFLWLFFFTDHLIFFHLIEVLQEDALSESIYNWGQIFLTGFHSFNFLRLGCFFYRMAFLQKQQVNKEIKIARCDLLAHTMDFSRLICINLDLLGFQYVSFSAIVSSLARLNRLRYK